MLKGPSPSPERLLPVGPAIAAVGVPLLLYLFTLYPGVGDRQGTGDAIEYQLVGSILSVAHEPGYPQYVLLSHLWSYLPVPLSLASKINLLSAVFTTIAGLFFFSAARNLSGSDSASVLATWLVLVSPNVWLLSTQAEVYTLHLMWVSAVLWAALQWHDSGKQRFLVALFFFYALSFGNHLTMITLLPALMVLILANNAHVVRCWQNWVWATLAILTGLLQYGLLLWRSYNPHPALLHRFPLQADLRELLDYITGSRFVDRHLLQTGLQGWLLGVWEALVVGIQQLTVPFALLCGLGLVVGLRQHRLKTVFLGLVAASVVAFAAAYGIKDSLLYTMPAWFCAGLLGAIGLGRVLQMNPHWRRRLVATAVLLIAALITWRGSELRVSANPTDLEPVLAVAEPGSGILAAFKQRRARLLRLYYQYGQITEKALQVDFHSVNETLATGLEDGQDQPLYFRDPRAARILDRAFIDYSVLSTNSEGQSIYVTQPGEPLETLELRPLWNGSLAIAMRDRSLDLLGEQTLHLFLVSAKHRRSKGHLTLDTRGNPSWLGQLESALAVASPGDRLLLVAPRLAEGTRKELATVLESQTVDLLSLPDPQRHTIAWWSAGGIGQEVLLLSDLTEELILEIGDAGGAPEASGTAN